MGLVAIGDCPYNGPLATQQDADMKRLILMMPLIASGCADFAFNSNLDKENFDEYFAGERADLRAERARRPQLPSTSAPSRGILPERCQPGGAQCR